MVSANSNEYGTLATEVGMVFNFVVVFWSKYFLFRQVPTNYPVIDDWHVNRQGASNRFLLLIIRQY